MGSVGDFLFGEDPELITGSQSTMTPEQMALLNKLSGLLGGQLGRGVDPYEDQITAELTGIERGGIERAGLLGGQGLDYISELLGRGPEAEMDYWERSVKAPAMEVWEEDILPMISEKYAAQNAMDSGAWRRAIAKSGQRLTTNLGAQLGDLLYKSQWQKAELPGQGMDIIAQMLGAGGVERGVEQAKGQEGYQKWQMSQPWANPWLEKLGIPLGVQPMQPYQYQTEGSSGILGSMLPAIGAAVGGPLGGALGGGLSGLLSGGSSGPQMYSMSNPGWYSGWNIG